MDREEDAYPHNSTLRAVSNERRREVVGFLLERDEPVIEDDLAEYLLAIGPYRPQTDTTPDQRRIVRTRLTHHHLPALEDACLVDWNRERGTVGTTSHPALGDPRFRQILQMDEEGVDAALRGVAHEHRRIALIVLREARTSVTRTDLAREILRREAAVTGRRPPTVDDCLVALHHLHLPKLADEGLVEFDPETGRATYADHAALEAIFRVVTEPDERLVDKLDAFLGGLHGSYERTDMAVSEPIDWPHFWRDPTLG